jgi:hopene-associated glycosyltransferase HpnB
MLANIIAVAAAIGWIYIIAARGGFWLVAERETEAAALTTWPPVAVIIPARNEADGIAEAVDSLLRQDYSGPCSIVVVDDQSIDDTAGAVRRSAVAAGATDRVTILSGAPLPQGWTGKLWAMKQGIDHAQKSSPTYLLLTDADIVYERDAVAKLVSRSHADGLVLNSWMVKLRCESFAERALIPAFIFFFQMLYPFAWVRRQDRTTAAAAAGGCMLVRLDALRAAGGLEPIRGELIDDCALASSMKKQGAILLGLTERVRSIRAYPKINDIRLMVARSAYAQLRYSPLLLAGTLASMTLIFIAPVLCAFSVGLAQVLGLLTWGAMAIVFQPTLRFYRVSPLWGLLLPAIALSYMAFTIDSAYLSYVGRGGLWKGRIQAKKTGCDDRY